MGRAIHCRHESRSAEDEQLLFVICLVDLFAVRCSDSEFSVVTRVRKERSRLVMTLSELEEEARKRKERLLQWKSKKQLLTSKRKEYDDDDDDDNNNNDENNNDNGRSTSTDRTETNKADVEETIEFPKPIFRNYKPHESGPLSGAIVLPRPKLVDVKSMVGPVLLLIVGRRSFSGSLVRSDRRTIEVEIDG
jgi:hypothetical protein